MFAASKPPLVTAVTSQQDLVPRFRSVQSRALSACKHASPTNVLTWRAQKETTGSILLEVIRGECSQCVTVFSKPSSKLLFGWQSFVFRGTAPLLNRLAKPPGDPATS